MLHLIPVAFQSNNWHDKIKQGDRLEEISLTAKSEETSEEKFAGRKCVFVHVRV